MYKIQNRSYMKKILLSVIFVFVSIANLYAGATKEWVGTQSSKTGNDAVVCVDAFGYIYVAGTYNSASTGKD